MQDVETLIKIIIPAILLIFWALSNLFNREGKQTAAKDRAAALVNRPTAYQPPRPPERRRVPPPPPAPRYVPSNDEVMIIRAEPNRPPGRPGPPAKRNAGRGRAGSTAGTPSRRVEPPATVRNRELLGGNVAADMNRSLELHPLTQTMASAGSTNSKASTASVDALSATNAPALFLALLDPVRIREAFVLNEILQPPLSRRVATARAVHDPSPPPSQV